MRAVTGQSESDSSTEAGHAESAMARFVAQRDTALDRVQQLEDRERELLGILSTERQSRAVQLEDLDDERGRLINATLRAYSRAMSEAGAAEGMRDYAEDIAEKGLGRVSVRDLLAGVESAR